MTNEIEKQSFGRSGLAIIDPSSGSVTGNFCAIQFLEDSELSSIEAPYCDTTIGKSPVGIAFIAGTVLYTPFTNIELSSGLAAIYKSSL